MFTTMGWFCWRSYQEGGMWVRKLLLMMTMLSVPVQVMDKLLNGCIRSLVDANLGGDVNLDGVERVCKVACWFILDNEFDRPTMGER
jgi:hypothetical protein